MILDMKASFPSCGCGKGAAGAPASPPPEPVVTGIEGETGAAQ